MSNSLVFLATSRHPDVLGWVCAHANVWQCWHQSSRMFTLTMIGWHSSILSEAKRGNWKKESTEEALKCWNLERIIDAEQQGEDAPSELKMEDLLNKEAGRDREDDNKKAAGGVTFIE